MLQTQSFQARNYHLTIFNQDTRDEYFTSTPDRAILEFTKFVVFRRRVLPQVYLCLSGMFPSVLSINYYTVAAS